MLGSDNHGYQCFLRCPIDAIFSRFDSSSKLLQDFLQYLADGDVKSNDGLKIGQEIPYINKPKLNVTAVDDGFHNAYGENLFSHSNITRSPSRDTFIKRSPSRDTFISTVSSSQSDEVEEIYVPRKKNKRRSKCSSHVDTKLLQNDYRNDDTKSNWQISSDRCPTIVTSSQGNSAGSVSYTNASLKVWLNS